MYLLFFMSFSKSKSKRNNLIRIRIHLLWHRSQTRKPLHLGDPPFGDPHFLFLTEINLKRKREWNGYKMRGWFAMYVSLQTRPSFCDCDYDTRYSIDGHFTRWFGLVSLFNGISTLFWLFNAKAILLEEQ